MSYEIYQVYGEGSLCSAQECNNNELNRRSAVMLVLTTESYIYWNGPFTFSVSTLDSNWVLIGTIKQ